MGVILAFETARQLGTRSIFAEEVRDPDGGIHREFRRGFTIEPGERVLLVDDILTTGGSLLAMIPAVEALGGEIVACVVMVDRSGGRATLTSPTTGRTYPLRALWQLDLPTYEPGAATCPRCAAGDPLVRAGQHRAPRPPAPADVPWTAAPVGCSPRSLFVLVVGGRGRDGPAAAPRPTRTAAWTARTTAVVGVIVGVDAAGLADVRAFTCGSATARSRTFGLAALENGVEFPPGHLAEHQATAEPVRVWYPERGRRGPGHPPRGRRHG